MYILGIITEIFKAGTEQAGITFLDNEGAGVGCRLWHRKRGNSPEMNSTPRRSKKSKLEEALLTIAEIWRDIHARRR
jgi:hypothetical protein